MGIYMMDVFFTSVNRPYNNYNSQGFYFVRRLSYSFILWITWNQQWAPFFTLQAGTLNRIRILFQLAIANKKTGPPTRIPLPTGRQFVQLTSPSKEELSPSHIPNKTGGGRITQSKPMSQQYPVRKATAEVLTADISSPMTPKFPVDVPNYTGPIPPEYMQGGTGDNRYNIVLYY